MPTADDVQIETLADLTHALSGAEIEHIANEAGLLAIKESLDHNTPADSVRVTASHFFQTINTLKNLGSPISQSLPGSKNPGHPKSQRL